ncbi:hepatic lectin-like isoform X2 [Pecten maximus]|uniref:hepatic lectin-like isoform X2 n=1 Tax=Pecten maximus TaxID=6579 RepID=UPI001458CEB7|nr:hepatic lectin-like isoform X2 [Pecten maximus]
MDNDCRGYKRFADPLTVQGTRVWKKALRCHPYYTYTQALDLCWKWYDGLNWVNAKAFCPEEDSRLIVLDTYTKLNAVRNHLVSSGGGHKQQGTWVWLNGKPVDMSPSFWGPGEPSGQSFAIYLAWNLDFHGRFDDSGGFVDTRYICEKP